MRTLRKILALSPAERRLVAAAWWEIHRVARDLKRRPLAEVAERCQRRGERRPRLPLLPARVIGLVAAAARANLRPYRCLEQALVGHTLLTAMGSPHQLHIGVARPDGVFRAHAWLEVEGTAPDRASAGLRTIWSAASQAARNNPSTARGQLPLA